MEIGNFDLNDVELINKLISYKCSDGHFIQPLNKHMVETNTIEKYQDIIDFAFEKLIEHKFDCRDKTTYNAEYHTYFNDKKDVKTIESQFDKHIDDDNDETDYPVNTCLIYLQNTFSKGGNLCLYNNYHDDEPIREIDTSPDFGTVKVVLFHGKDIHAVSNCIGIGRRDAIVIQFERYTEPFDVVDFFRKLDEWDMNLYGCMI